MFSPVLLPLFMLGSVNCMLSTDVGLSVLTILTLCLRSHLESYQRSNGPSGTGEVFL